MAARLGCEEDSGTASAVKNAQQALLDVRAAKAALTPRKGEDSSPSSSSLSKLVELERALQAARAEIAQLRRERDEARREVITLRQASGVAKSFSEGNWKRSSLHSDTDQQTGSFTPVRESRKVQDARTPSLKETDTFIEQVRNQVSLRKKRLEGGIALERQVERLNVDIGTKGEAILGEEELAELEKTPKPIPNLLAQLELDPDTGFSESQLTRSFSSTTSRQLLVPESGEL
mmetsp:Transcript_9797/g.17263  ORF Transcript_9797/g.17263 Transcript_9797/m.17263 type:complete len:233 (-) Transcript_9797:1224-1922(-)